jgi:hypothetical protein
MILFRPTRWLFLKEEVRLSAEIQTYSGPVRTLARRYGYN